MEPDEQVGDQASDIADAVPSDAGDGSVTAFCATCPNWIEVEFQSRIPGNMPLYMAIEAQQNAVFNSVPVPPGVRNLE